jgi:hypothetical protein
MTSSGDYTVLRGIIANYGSSSGNQAWTTSQPIVTTNTTPSTGQGTGALVVSGGASINGNTYIQGGLFVNGTQAGGGSGVNFDTTTISAVSPGVYGVSPNISTSASILSQTASQGQYLVKTGTTAYGWSTINIPASPPRMYYGQFTQQFANTPYNLGFGPPYYTNINSYQVFVNLLTNNLAYQSTVLLCVKNDFASFTVSNIPADVPVQWMTIGT